jgi:hypothetical protein
LRELQRLDACETLDGLEIVIVVTIVTHMFENGGRQQAGRGAAGERENEPRRRPLLAVRTREKNV